MTVGVHLRPAVGSWADAGGQPGSVLAEVLRRLGLRGEIRTGAVDGTVWASVMVAKEPAPWGEALLVEIHQGPEMSTMYGPTNDGYVDDVIVSIQPAGSSEDEWSWSQRMVDGIVAELVADVID